MMSITCPHCSRVGSLKTTVPPGTRVRCPGCQNRFEVQPEPEDVASDVIELEDVPDPDIPPVSQVPTPNDADDYEPSNFSTYHAPSSKRSQPLSPDQEPWFFRWIEVFAGWIWDLAVVALVMVIVALVSLVILILKNAIVSGEWEFFPMQVKYFALGSAWIVFVWTVSLIPVFLLSGLLRLAVDAARSLRAIRNLLYLGRQAP